MTLSGVEYSLVPALVVALMATQYSLSAIRLSIEWLEILLRS